jgi:acetyl esterase
MQKCQVMLVVCLVLACMLGMRSAEAAQPKRVEYKQVGKVKLHLHVFYPSDWKPTDKRPAAVFFFGGGWVGGTPKQFYPHCEHLAANGIVAAAAEYRVKKTHGTTPFECVADGKSAVRWMRASAKTLGIDPERIISGGGSAGGHVAACTGVIEALDEKKEDASVSSEPNAMVLFNPVIDTSKQGYGYNKLKERYKEISPVEHVRKGIVPTIIFVGTADTTTPASGDRKFCKLMKAAGNRCELHEYKGRKHGFFNNRGGDKDYKDTVEKMDVFLKSLGYLD